jgi:hypothetical protein
LINKIGLLQYVSQDVHSASDEFWYHFHSFIVANTQNIIMLT